MGLLEHLAGRWTNSNQLAIVSDEEITYGDLGARVARARGLLVAEGLRPGDILAVRLEKCAGFVELLLGAFGEGITVLPINPRAPLAEVHALLDQARPRLVIGEPGPISGHQLRARLDTAPERHGAGIPEHAAALLCFTSGTTGRPKGALLSHAALRADLEALHAAWGWRDDDVLLHALPLFHIHGLVVAQLGALWAAATTHWMTSFEPADALRRMEEDGITVFMGVPTYHHRLLALDRKPDTLHLRLCTSGSAPLPAETHRRFTERFGVEIVERYGMTEIGIVLSNPTDGPRKPGSVGLPLPGVRCRITDPVTGEDVARGQVGEVRIAGPTLMTGYLGRPDATDAAIGDGWMHTGDLGSEDDDGYVHLLGRRDDLILFGGFNVYPLEVESALIEHPTVEQAAVVGLPDPDKGEIPAALIVGARAHPTELTAWLRSRLSAYKIPRRWAIAESLPRNPTGKIERTAVRRQLLDLTEYSQVMTIPHIQTIREHRAAVQAGQGAAQLIHQAESLQTVLAMCRSRPLDELPGADLMEALTARPGLEGLGAVEAPPTANWEARVRARELALRAALANLRPLAASAHDASHAIHDLRKEQLDLLMAPEHSELHARVQALNHAYAATRNEQLPTIRRLQAVDPLCHLIRIYSEQLSTALSTTTTNRDALCTAFVEATRAGVTVAADALQLNEPLPLPSDDAPDQQAEAMLRAIAALNTRVTSIADELATESRTLAAELHRVETEIEALLG